MYSALGIIAHIALLLDSGSGPFFGGRHSIKNPPKRVEKCLGSLQLDISLAAR
jgi:hypothetical protein